MLLQNCFGKRIKRLCGNTGENYDKLRLIYEPICCINDRPILVPGVSNFIYYQKHALTLEIWLQNQGTSCQCPYTIVQIVPSKFYFTENRKRNSTVEVFGRGPTHFWV